MNFDLKRPCRDCPFILGTTMILAPGRMDGIAEALQSDLTVFPCHKTTHALAPADREDDEAWHGREQACMGALAFTLKHHGRMPVLLRLAILGKRISRETIEANFDTITPPGEWEAHR